VFLLNFIINFFHLCINFLLSLPSESVFICLLFFFELLSSPFSAFFVQDRLLLLFSQFCLRFLGGLDFCGAFLLCFADSFLTSCDSFILSFFFLTFLFLIIFSLLFFILGFFWFIFLWFWSFGLLLFIFWFWLFWLFSGFLCLGCIFFSFTSIFLSIGSSFICFDCLFFSILGLNLCVSSSLFNISLCF